MAEMTECPKCGKVTYSFLHSCPFAGWIKSEYNDEDLREWAEGIWAAVEYRGDGVRALKRVLAEIEERHVRVL